MNDQREDDRRGTDASVREELQRNPYVLLQLAENSLSVAQRLRDNYFHNTAQFIKVLRRAIKDGAEGRRPDPPLVVHRVGDIGWQDVAGEVVTFLDGGVGRVQMASQAPILLRV